MSASHFGSGFWPDDYFGLYFQPEAGGVIIGALSGSFAGTSTFSGGLAGAGETSRSQGGWDPYYYKKRKKPQPPVEAPILAPAPAPFQPPRIYSAPRPWNDNAPLLPPAAIEAPRIDWEHIAFLQAERVAEAAQRRFEEEDDEEIMLLLAA